MKPIERVEKLMKIKDLTVSGFEKTVGVANGTLVAALKRKSNLKDETLNSILNAFPEVSPEWLLTGNGSTFRGETVQEREPYPEPEPVTVEDLIAQKVVEILRPFLREKTDEILVALKDLQKLENDILTGMKDLQKLEDEIKKTVGTLHIAVSKVRNNQEATLQKANEMLSKSEDTFKKMEDTYNKVLIIEERH